jgi:dTDP-4-amino-4,6-dideoxygalactose transaminase
MINVTKTFFPPLEEYNQQLERVWKNEWMTNRGELVQELEKKLINYLGVNHLLFVNNGTIALQIALKALDIKGEVITTPFSYVATTSSIVWENCQPVFVDIRPDTFCINADLIEAAITEKTTAILATHVYGVPCDVEKIAQIAQKYHLKVIYDAAHCFGVNYKGTSLLNYGDISTLSFHATKLFHTGEGGGIVVHNPEMYHKVFYMHNFGHNGPEAFWGLGINGKSSELHAAMGLAIFPYIQSLIAKRKAISAQYDTLLTGLPLKRPLLPEHTEYNYAYYPVIFETESKLLQVRNALNAEQIFPRRYFYPSLNSLNYVNNKKCVVAEQVSRTVLCLPLSYAVQESEVNIISTIITNSIK